MFYIPSSVLVQYIPKGIQRRVILILGLVLAFPVNLLIGPSKVFGFPDSLIIMLLGQALMGIVNPLLLIPTLPEMIDCITSSNKRYHDYRLNDLASAVFNSFLGLG